MRCRQTARIVPSVHRILGFTVTLLAVALAPATAQAATFPVNTTFDGTDATPGDAVCATATGTCSLRAAIQEANATGGGDTVALPAGTYTLTLAGTGEDMAATGDLDVRDAL